jgi:nicotinate-nucleotide adenylyltransferase
MIVQKQPLGIFGGSFDPPHAGHLHAARAAQKAFELEQVLFIPAARPPHKPGRTLASGAHRLAMLELLVAGNSDFSVDARELGRAGPSYTVTTLEDLAESLAADLHLIIGTDNLAGLPDWRDLERILELAQPIVIFRSGNPAEHLAGLEDKLGARQLERLGAGFVELPPVEISSTELRERLARGQDPGQLLPSDLQLYIREHELYREQD